MQRLKRLALSLLAVITLSVSADGNLRPFDGGSYAAIVESYQGRPFVLGFWSLDCPPCHHELSMLGRWIAEHPDTSLVLVSTDENASEDVGEVLYEHGLQGAENWMAAEPFDERLRFTIDPLWYGELPRSYLFGRDANRQAISGALPVASLSEWHAVNR